MVQPLQRLLPLRGSGGANLTVSLNALQGKRYRDCVRLPRLESFGVIADPKPITALGAFLLRAAVRSRERLQEWLRTTMPLMVPLGTCTIIANASLPYSVCRDYGFVCFFIPVLLFSAWRCAE